MASRNIKVRCLSDISSLGELQQARKELELLSWYSEQRLADNTETLFSFDNLLSSFAPPWALGIFRVIRRRFFGGRGDCDCA